MSQGIFRQSALERLASPERLDEMIRITSPRSWLALAGLLAVVAALVLWAVFGSVTTTVQGTGVVIPAGGLSVVAAPQGGVVASVGAHVGGRVRAGQVVARLADGRAVRSPVTGTVLSLAAQAGAYAQAGNVLAVIAAADRAPALEVYVPAAAAAALKPGIAVQFAPAGYPAQEFGFLLGRVVGVSPFPAPYASVLALVGSPSLARLLTAAAPVAAVDVSLLSSGSRVAWSLPASRGLLPAPGTTGTARLILSVRRPAAFVFGQ